MDCDNTCQVKDTTNLWGVGDCASIPDPHGNPYPQLAQHALEPLARERLASLEHLLDPLVRGLGIERRGVDDLAELDRDEPAERGGLGARDVDRGRSRGGAHACAPSAGAPTAGAPWIGVATA